MADFFAALGNPAIPFLRYALIAGILSSIAFGMVGTYVVVKRITYIAGSIAHSVLAGIGLSLYLSARHGITWLSPLLGAVIAAVISALIIGLVSMYGKQREDTVIGSIWAIGMGVGILLIARTPGYKDPMTYLFGNILMISRTELFLIGSLDLVVIILGLVFYHQFLAVSFDEEFSRVRGMKARFYYMLLLLLTALTVVLLTTIVGIVMVIALLTLPPAVASLFSKNLWQTMLLAGAATVVFTVVGMMISYAADTPSGSTIIIFAGIVYIVFVIMKGIIKRLRKKLKGSRI
ncbi:MAG: metal ABC transporter permease [Spirochaetales bacterium]|nr:MAG: metal ABC transporter permease [Spirochaetales bacterium]